MKNVLKVFVLVLVVFCMVVSCSKNASSSGSSGGSSNDADGSEVIVSSNDGSSVSSGGGSSTAAVSSDNSLKNAVGKIKHDKEDVIFNNWAGIPWTDFGLSSAPAEPAGGKLEAAFTNKVGTPYIFLSNVSRAAYESLCREMEAGLNKEGSRNTIAIGWFQLNLGLDDFDDCYQIMLRIENVDSFALYKDEWEASHFLRDFYFRIYYYGSPVNGIVMTIQSESYL